MNKDLKQIQNYYDEWDGKGENPRPYTVGDSKQRSRRKEFLERQAKRDLLQKEFLEARAKYGEK